MLRFCNLLVFFHSHLTPEGQIFSGIDIVIDLLKVQIKLIVFYLERMTLKHLLVPDAYEEIKCIQKINVWKLHIWKYWKVWNFGSIWLLWSNLHAVSIISSTRCKSIMLTPNVSKLIQFFHGDIIYKYIFKRSFFYYVFVVLVHYIYLN